MEIEIRRVSYAWDHPRKNGKFVQLIDQSFSIITEQYNLRKQYWFKGFVELPLEEDSFEEVTWEQCSSIRGDIIAFEDHYGYSGEPKKEHYRPDWYYQLCTCFQMYNSQTLTPVSPVFLYPDDLASWARKHLREEHLEQLHKFRFDFSLLEEPRDWLIDTIQLAASYHSYFLIVPIFYELS